MYLKRFSIVIVLILVISLICSSVIFLFRNKKSLQLVTNSVYADDGTIYFLEQSDDNYDVYHTDENGNLIDKICNKKIDDNDYHNALNLQYSNGKVYMVEYRNDIIDVEDDGYKIIECDFKHNKFNKVIDLEDTQLIFEYRINNDTTELLYLYYNSESYEYLIKKVSVNQKLSENTTEIVAEYDENIIYNDLILDRYGNKYFTTIDGELYRYTGYNKYEKLYPSDDSYSKAVEFSYDNGDRIYFIDSNENAVMYYDINTGVCSNADDKLYNAIDSYNLTYNTNYCLSDLTNINFSPDGYFTCSVDGMDNNYLLGIYNKNGFNIVSDINNNFNIGKSVLIILAYGLIIFTLISLAALLLYVFIQKYISLIIRMATAFMLLFCIVITVIFNGMKSVLNDAFTKSVNDKILYMCENKTKDFPKYSDEDIETLMNTEFNKEDHSDWKDDVEYSIYNLTAFNYHSSTPVTEYDGENVSETSIDIRYDYYFSVFMMDDEKFNIVFDSSSISNMPAQYMRTRYVSDIIKKVMETGEKQLTSDLFLMQECTSIYAPLFNENGDVTGVFQISMVNNTEILFRVNQAINRNIFKIIIIMMILIIIITIFMVIFIKPLKPLKDKAMELMHGNVGITVKPVGNNEITALTIQFNHMSSELSENISNMKLLCRYYEYYVPKKLFSILKKSDISEISLNDKYNISMAVLHIRIHIKNIDVEEHSFVKILNEFLQKVIAKAQIYDGIIEYYNRYEMKILYYEKYNNAVRTAVAVHEIINEMSQIKTDYKIFADSLISFENCIFNITGNNKRISIASSSDNSFTSDDLNFNYDVCNLIVTDRLINKSENFFDIFDTRFIGIHTIDGENMKLFEVFNGDNLYNQNMKRIYKDKFENAVKLYLLKDYREARNIFIEIFENYPEDCLSGNYICLCDDLLKKGGDVSEKV